MQSRANTGLELSCNLVTRVTPVFSIYRDKKEKVGSCERDPTTSLNCIFLREPGSFFQVRGENLFGGGEGYFRVTTPPSAESYRNPSEKRVGEY